MYFNVNFNLFFKLIKVHLSVSELYMHKEHNPKYHPPHLDNEKVADVDALACVSRGHCDGLGDGGVLLSMRLYLL